METGKRNGLTKDNKAQGLTWQQRRCRIDQSTEHPAAEDQQSPWTPQHMKKRSDDLFK